ncbi:MAG: ABC-2 family transporter protein [bacterium]
MRPFAPGSVLRKYLPFTRGVLQESLTYRFRFVFWLLFEVFYLVIAYFLWQGVYSAHATTQGIAMVDVTIGGYTFGMMILYVFFERIVAGLTNMSAANFIEDDIRDGNIAMRLIKPLDYRVQLFFQSFGFAVINCIIFALPLTIGLVVFGSASGLPFSLDFASAIMTFFAIIFAGIINFLVSFAFGMIIFLTLNSFGMWQLKEAVERILSGGLIPITLFPLWLRVISGFLPFAQMRFVPVTFLLGTYNDDLAGGLTALAVQIFWMALLFILTTLAWRRVTRRIVVQGG